MHRYLLTILLMLGFSASIMAQATDPAYVKKLDKLYKHSIPVIQPSELETAIRSVQHPIILDTRSPEEFEVSHIKGARFVDYSKFSKKDVEDLDRARPIVVYCTVGYRSERIGDKLAKLGFTTVYNLYGGIFEWVNQGYAVVDAHGKPTSKVHAYSEDWGQWMKQGEKVYK